MDNLQRILATIDQLLAGPENRVLRISIPRLLWDHLNRCAQTRGITTAELLKHFLKLGLVAMALEEEPGSALIVRDQGGQRERELVLSEKGQGTRSS